MSDLETCYAWHRQQQQMPYRRWLMKPTMGAMEALLLARVDVAAGTDRYPSEHRGWSTGKPFLAYGTQWLRWIESPAECGLREVGFADEIAPRRVEHRGWFTDPSGDDREVYRGVVYQLPARKRCATYVPGYINTGEGPGGVCFSFMPGDLEHGEAGDNDRDNDEQARKDCALTADHIAEHMAEEEREYQSAWQAGALYFSQGEQLAQLRRSTRAVLAELKAQPAAAPGSAVCGALRQFIKDQLRNMDELRQERAKLRRGDGGDYLSWNDGDKRLVEAFNEGAQL